MKIMKIIPVVFLLMIGITEGWAQEKNWVGTWQYSAPQADYQYQKGNIAFTMEGKELKAFVEVNGQKIQARQLEVSGNQASFNIYIEGESIKVSLQKEDNELTGNAAYSGGKVTLNGKKSA